ncbi:hypothetical protein BDW59DRAFT_157154 [Aspergillus cavernicola]|uniref:Uncharacterized protein n=1 Tax=Aspergillus cavernicola TaxID=176166 RepID=A0ABR4IZ48_9EURO
MSLLEASVVAKSSYGPLMNTTADTVWAVKGDEPDSAMKADLANSINALQKMVISREIDYEGHRFDALKNAFPSVSLEYDNVVLQTTKGAKSLNIAETMKANPGENNLEQRIADWTKNTYHTDTTMNSVFGKTEGKVRLEHFNALQDIKRAASVAQSGVCNF